MNGFRNRMYAIVSQVVTPVAISRRGVDPRSEIRKNPSRPPLDPTRTTRSCSVLAIALPPLRSLDRGAPWGRRREHRHGAPTGQILRSAEFREGAAMLVRRGRSPRGPLGAASPARRDGVG